MTNFSFKKIHEDRRCFLIKNKENDHVIINGKNNVLISSPHGVFQTRLGKKKVCEPGSLSTALFLQKQTDSFLIAKTKNNCDDANFDEKSEYKNDIQNLIKKYNIKYVLDFHGLSKQREVDVNLGTNFGNNIGANISAFNKLVKELKTNNFNVQIDEPFRGGGNTISGFVQTLNKNVFSLQIEINCGITNVFENRKKYKTLLETLNCWISKLK